MTVLGILDCDELAPELAPDYRDYSAMFENLLGPFLPSIQWREYRLLQGVFPQHARECDAYLITGSKTGVYDEADWLPDLRGFIRQAYAVGVPLVGICFGHQMLAHSLGGRAEKSARGWGIGAYAADATAYAKSALPESPQQLNLLYSHQDQVSALPPEAEVLFGNTFCPIAAFMIPHKVLAFQGHPEFTRDYSRRLMALRQSRYAPGQYERAVATLDSPLHAEWVAQCIAAFVTQESDNNADEPNH